MEPRIQYAKTEDGVNIAFSVTGQGLPLLHVGWHIYGHLEMEWRIPEYHDWYQGLAKNRRLIWYDSRGTGLSERDIADYSLDARVQDLSTVVDCLGLERFALVGLEPAVSVTYTARNPERVSHLVLWSPVTRSSDYESRTMAVRSFASQDWNVYAETAAEWYGISAPESRKLITEMVLECGSPDTYRLVLAEQWDLTPLLSVLQCKTLVLHRRGNPFVMPGTVQRVASTVPGSHLVMVEGSEWWPGAGDVDAVLSAIDEFLSEGEETEAKTELPEGTAVILFADIAGSTALTEQLGDAAFRAKARDLDERLRSVIREAGGTPVEGKVLGDGVMAVFTSARQGIDGAIRCNAAAQDTGLELHLGVHAGDVIREGNTVYGGAVNIAARIAGASAAGEILVSDIVRGLARTSADVAFEDRGEHTLKGIGEPQRLFAVRGEGA